MSASPAGTRTNVISIVTLSGDMRGTGSSRDSGVTAFQLEQPCSPSTVSQAAISVRQRRPVRWQ